MILGDSSAWIEHLRDRPSAVTARLRELLGDSELVITDVVVLEVLAGARDPGHLRRLERMLYSHDHVPTEQADYVAAAEIWRACRRGGDTVRALLDCIIAAVAMRVGASVLHNDRDFDVMARHVGLAIDRP